MSGVRSASPAGDLGAVIDAVDHARLRASAGATVETAGLPPRAQRAVRVAAAVGAPIGPALDATREAMHAAAEHERAIRVATAQGKVVAIGLLVAPFVLVPMLGAAAGIDIVGFYVSPLGAAVAAVAMILLAAGGSMILALVRRASQPAPPRRRVDPRQLVGPAIAGIILAAVAHPIVGLVPIVMGLRGRPVEQPDGVEEAAELMAIASLGGAGFGQMLRVAADELPTIETELQRAAFAVEIAADPVAAGLRGGVRELDRLIAVVMLARDLGAPVADTLRGFARELRADEHAARLAAAARLPAQLTVPTVLCLLPATLLLVGAPLVAGALAVLPT